MFVNRLHRIDDKCEEHQIGSGSFPRGLKIDAGVGDQRPITVLAGTIDAFERLFVEKDLEVVMAGNFLHQVHHQHSS